MPISIRIAEPMLPTRPCKFCLSFQDDSVFADFDIDQDQRVVLVRISFDRFGCCRTEEHIKRMNLNDSRILLEWMDKEDVNREEIEAALSRYFQENNDVIWNDALEFHELL